MSEAAESLVVIEGGKSIDPTSEKPMSVIGSSSWRANMRRRAKALVDELDLGYMELGRILYNVYDVPVDGDPGRGPVYSAWGYRSFREYVEGELGTSYKRALRLRRIWFTLEYQLKDLDPSLKERIARLGYSKVRELIRVLTIRNAENWVEIAEKNAYKALEKHINDECRRQGLALEVLEADRAEEAKQLKEGEEDSSETAGPIEILPEEEKLTHERFALYPEQLQNLHQALKKAEKLSGSEKKGHLLDLICLDFLSGNDFISGDRDTRIRYLAKIERLVGLKLTVIDPEAREIVYGLDNLNLVAEQ